MRLEAGCNITFEAEASIPIILMLRPRSGYGQWIVREEYCLKPSVPVTEYTDSYGNLCQRLVVPEGRFQIQFTACVETSDTIDVRPGAPFVPVNFLPENVLQFLLPSRYCQSDLLASLATEIVADAAPGYDQVVAIQEWIHTQVEYRYGSSNASTSAVDTAAEKVGVCRDFAHLGISLCRSLNIPARMVVGYLYQLEPMDLHAWFEAFVSDVSDVSDVSELEAEKKTEQGIRSTAGRWYTFDATQSEPRGNRIAIAYGRDAADVALATQFGAMQLTQMHVWVNLDGDKS